MLTNIVNTCNILVFFECYEWIDNLSSLRNVTWIYLSEREAIMRRFYSVAREYLKILRGEARQEGS